MRHYPPQAKLLSPKTAPTIHSECRMRLRKIATLVLLLLAATSFAFAQKSLHLTATSAKDHVGENATVCGHVASTHFASTTRGRPTFINLDKPYPNQIFTILIWGSDRGKFGAPETVYRDKTVCVSGSISSYRGVPEIVARDPGQISLQGKR